MRAYAFILCLLTLCGCVEAQLTPTPDPSSTPLVRQRRGHGRALSTLVEQYARRLGLRTLLVNADPAAVGYYEKMGWKACIWDEAELTGIAAHCKQMSKALFHNS